MTKKLLSIAALAAITTTSVSAFDAERGSANIGLETSKTNFVRGIMNNANMVTATTALTVSQQSTGDALIYPAFYSSKGWSTEFSVINNKDVAVIAKVVLYSAVNSKELRDFNIYLSAHDVFRATIKDGKLISTDSSTRAKAQDSVATVDPLISGYLRKDTAPMASESKPFETTVDEDVGYFAVFAMAEASDTDSYNHYASYHKKHNQLWKDYRHMLDQCRGEGWRTTANNYGGIFKTPQMSTPNVNLRGILQQADQSDATADCGTVHSSQYVVSGKERKGRPVKFVSPMNDALSGSVLLKADDSRGTRSLLLPATAIQNFTEDTNNTGMLWSEGELANIADRCIEPGTVTNSGKYNTTCLNNDITAFNINSTSYEFRDAANSQLLITQPYKRTVIQIQHRKGLDGQANNADVLGDVFSYYNKGIERYRNSAGLNYLVTNYGEFDLAQPSIYDDNENLSTNTSDGYIVSPAPIQASTPGIPNELSVFNPLGSYSDSEKGFATVNYTQYAHGIVTQMSVSDVSGNEETNWIYPATN